VFFFSSSSRFLSPIRFEVYYQTKQVEADAPNIGTWIEGAGERLEKERDAIYLLTVFVQINTPSLAEYFNFFGVSIPKKQTKTNQSLFVVISFGYNFKSKE